MGIGDNLMATGIARGAAARGKRIAFGDGRRIIWDQHSAQIFRGPDLKTQNPNIAPPCDERASDLEWVPFYKGNRLYNTHDHVRNRWHWNMNFRAKPGEVIFAKFETAYAKNAGQGFVVIEPNLPEFKTCGPNKQWPVERYDKLARYLRKTNQQIVQFYYNSGHRIPYAKQIKTQNFRQALAIMARAALYIGPEGGLHHGAAAVGIPAVVLFGGFIPPQVTGYKTHTNLTGGAEACGSLDRCEHCRAAMEAITVDSVHDAALAYLMKDDPAHAARRDMVVGEEVAAGVRGQAGPRFETTYPPAISLRVGDGSTIGGEFGRSDMPDSAGGQAVS